MPKFMQRRRSYVGNCHCNTGCVCGSFLGRDTHFRQPYNRDTHCLRYISSNNVCPVHFLGIPCSQRWLPRRLGCNRLRIRRHGVQRKHKCWPCCSGTSVCSQRSIDKILQWPPFSVRFRASRASSRYCTSIRACWRIRWQRRYGSQ